MKDFSTDGWVSAYDIFDRIFTTFLCKDDHFMKFKATVAFVY